MSTPPSDANSLLVPIAMDVFVVNSSTGNQEVLAWYYANYNNLSSFQSPLPAPFDQSSYQSPIVGIHLHWALPDALTHGAQNADGAFSFPYVPNRWLVVRMDTSNQWEMTAWVIQSDALQSGQTTPGEGPGAFLDPASPSGISNDGKTVTINGANIGTNFTVSAWQAQGEPGGSLFLQAVGPGNISFAAYKPFSENVFSFIDSTPPAVGTATYSYMVVGWYSDPSGDPLNGATSPDDFTAILASLNWSLPANTPMPSTPPTSSLYHSFVADVQWPQGTPNVPATGSAQVAVGNTGIDALSALIQNYASVQSQTDSQNSQAWLNAGTTLSNLIQAAALELLDDYSQPGGTVLVNQQMEQSWFGSDPGGTLWQVVAPTATTNAFDINKNSLTAAQNSALIQQLSVLNASQQTYDAAQRSLQSQQGQLYRLWLNLSRSLNFEFGETPTTRPNFSNVLQPVLQNNLYPDLFNQVWDVCCTQATAQAALPDPTNAASANAWANQNWTFPATSGSGTCTLADLGLQLKATAAKNYWHPADPVVLILGAERAQNHGEDGRFNSDGTLTCRLPGQTITGIAASGQPVIPASALTSVTFNQLAAYTAVPAIPSLLTEAFFSDPLNAGMMSAAVSGTNSSTLNAAISALLGGDTNQGTWQGTPPSPLSYALWQQAWSPLFMEWMINYYPTIDANGNFTLSAWTFDGSNYDWAGSNINVNYALTLQGRTVVTPFAQSVLSDKLQKYLAASPVIDSTQMQTLVSTVMNWDILGQTLSGFTDQLITLLSQETFPPPVSSPNTPLPCPRPANATTASIPVGDLIQEQYHLMSVLEGDGTEKTNFFFPIRGGLVTFQSGKFQLVDAFGQTYDLSSPNTGNGFKPLTSTSLTLSGSAPAGLTWPFVLGPSLVQSAQLELNLLANDGSGDDIITSTNPNPICGWLLPNYLDQSIAVYDSSGSLLGELKQLPVPDNWRPRPGPAGNNPPPATPAQIANAALQNVVSALASQSADTLNDLMQVMDETLWMVNPLGGRSDASLPALIGRPLAVVQLQVGLTLNGDPTTNQMWNAMLTPTSNTNNFTPVQDTGGILDQLFPIRLGSLDLRNDGLLGYFLTGSGGYATFYTVHTSPEVSTSDTFIQPILNGTTFQGDLNVSANAPVTVTLILDPRGCAHAYSGILPVDSVQLDATLVQNFLRTLQVSFQTGPILADPGTLRTPQPAEKQGVWSWLQNINSTWEQDNIVNADDAARFPTQPPILREGWLQLSDLENDN